MGLPCIFLSCICQADSTRQIEGSNPRSDMIVEKDSYPMGGGGLWNRRNLEWQMLVQQKCTKSCHGIFRSMAIFLCVVWQARSHCARCALLCRQASKK